MTEPGIRSIVHFSGVVQGVGFRYTALQVSKRFDVVGTIENLADGRVRLVAEGASGEIESFISQVVETTSGRVSDIERQQTETTGEFTSFRIINTL